MKIWFYWVFSIRFRFSDMFFNTVHNSMNLHCHDWRHDKGHLDRHDMNHLNIYVNIEWSGHLMSRRLTSIIAVSEWIAIATITAYKISSNVRMIGHLLAPRETYYESHRPHGDCRKSLVHRYLRQRYPNDQYCWSWILVVNHCPNCYDHPDNLLFYKNTWVIPVRSLKYLPPRPPRSLLSVRVRRWASWTRTDPPSESICWSNRPISHLLDQVFRRV